MIDIQEICRMLHTSFIEDNEGPTSVNTDLFVYFCSLYCNPDYFNILLRYVVFLLQTKSTNKLLWDDLLSSILNDIPDQLHVPIHQRTILVESLRTNKENILNSSQYHNKPEYLDYEIYCWCAYVFLGKKEYI